MPLQRKATLVLVSLSFLVAMLGVRDAGSEGNPNLYDPEQFKTNTPPAPAVSFPRSSATGEFKGGNFLIRNGGFEGGGFTPWTVTLFPASNGEFFILTSRSAPLSIAPTPGPASGNFYAMSDQDGFGAQAISQVAFIEREPGDSVILEFDMFVNNWSEDGSAITGSLNPNVAFNQWATVDILKVTADPLSDNPSDVLMNLYEGDDGDDPPYPWTHYEFDITEAVDAAKASFIVRFAEVDNRDFFNMAVDNVRLVVGVPGRLVTSLSGVVTGQSGAPATCATVVASSLSFKGGGGITQGVGVTDLNGEYFIDDLPAGAYDIEVFSAGSVTKTLSTTIPVGGGATLNVTLTDRQPGAPVVFGHVRDSDSTAPLGGVRVDGVVDDEIFETTFTCANGDYELPLANLKGMRDITMRFSTDEFDTREEVVNIDPQGQTEFDTGLTPKFGFPGSLVGQVVILSSGEPIEEARVTATKSSTSHIGVTNDDGEYIIPNLEAGDYIIRASVPDFESKTVESTIDAGGAPKIEDFELGAEGEGEGEGASCGSTGGAILSTQQYFSEGRGDMILLLVLAVILGYTGRRMRRSGS